MSQKINFEIDSGEIIDDPSQSEFATARLRLFSSGENRHGMYCEEDVLQSTAITAYEKPVIFEIEGNDFGTHNDGRTVPAGFIVPNSAEFVREADGRLALYAISKIWKRYSGKFIEIFSKRNKTKSKLSVEMMMDETEEREDGLIGMKKFYYTAACILGDFITEASPGANIEMLSFSKEYEDAYVKEFGYDKFKELDFRIPSDVKDGVKLAIEQYAKIGKGGNSVSLSLAKFISQSEFATPEKIKLMYKKLSHYSKKELDNAEDRLRFNLWGGESGYRWCKDIFAKMEEIENKRSAFFDKTESADFLEKDGKEEMSVKKEKFEEAPIEEAPKEDMAVEEPKVEDEPKSEEMAVETPVEEEMAVEEESPKAEMSLDSYLDLAFMLALMEEETESRKEFLKEEDEFALKCAVDEMKKEGEKDFSVVSKGMFAKMKEMSAKMEKMEADNKAYMSEFEALKSFKKSADEARFSYEVESTLKEVESVMPADEIENARTESAKFSVENIDAWKNAVKAKAFTFAKPTEKKNIKTEVPRWAYGLDNVETKVPLWKK